MIETQANRTGQRSMKAGDLLEKMLKAMVRKTGELFVIIDESVGRVDINIRANPVDSRRLVGKKGKVINAIAVIASALWHPKVVKVNHIVSVGEDDPEWHKFQQDEKKWNPDTVASLLTQVVRGCFRDDPIVEVKDFDMTTVDMRLWVWLGEIHETKAERIAASIATVAPLISTLCGKYVRAIIESKEGHARSEGD